MSIESAFYHQSSQIELVRSRLLAASNPEDIPKKNWEKKSSGSTNLQMLETWLNDSIAAKQIIASKKDAALRLHKQALEFLSQAKEAQAAGDEQAVTHAALKAKLTMFKAIKIAGTKDIEEKKQHDFEKRYESVKALLDAHKRISKEKNMPEHTAETEKFVTTAMIQARQAYDKGDLENSKRLIDKAYLSLKLSLTRLRNGDTLVRSLDFTSKEEEYKYELDRNDTHKMLVNVLLKEKLSDSRFAQLINKNMELAADLRDQAETQAANGDYESAIKTLEQSTKQIIRAIRSAGIYIPG